MIERMKRAGDLKPGDFLIEHPDGALQEIATVSTKGDKVTLTFERNGMSLLGALTLQTETAVAVMVKEE